MPSRIVQSLDEVSSAYDALLVDLWGCYHNGITPYPAVIAALRRYRAQGGIVVLLTNAPRPAKSVRVFLQRIAAPEDTYDGIMSSGEACQRALVSGAHGDAFYYLGPDRDLHMLEDVGLAPTPIEAAGAILCTGLFDDQTETPEDYRARMKGWIARGLTLLCANPDIVVDRGAQRLWCAGALARQYGEMGGEVIWFGKPHRPTYDQSFELLAEIAGREIPRARVLAIGDGIGTDVKGGLDYGLDVMFVSGGLAAEEVGASPETPDPDRLARYLAREGQSPKFTIGRLR